MEELSCERLDPMRWCCPLQGVMEITIRWSPRVSPHFLRSHGVKYTVSKFLRLCSTSLSLCQVYCTHNFALLCARVMDLMPSRMRMALVLSWHLRVDFREQRLYSISVSQGSMFPDRSDEIKFVLQGSIVDLKHVCDDLSRVVGSTSVFLKLLLDLDLWPAW